VHIEFVEIANFRKLLSARVDLSTTTTLFVGANNSGKTSAMLAMRRFLSPRRCPFEMHDLTLCHWPKLIALGESWIAARDADEVVDLTIAPWVSSLPTIDLWLHDLLAAGAWTGALLGLILLVTRPAPRVDGPHLALTHRALHGFGTVGTIVVATLAVTGLINAWLLVGPGNIPALATTLYGQLLLAKLALFAAMMGLAALNRFRLTPRFETSIAAANHRVALGTLRRSLAVEAGCAVTILALVAWLGTLEPPVSAM